MMTFSRCSQPRCHSKRQGAFTLVELIMVISILGLLAVVALPRLSDSSSFQAVAFRTNVASALRYAQKTAVSHRRLVCAVVTTNSVTLSIASSYGSTTCDAALAGPDGNAAFATSSTDLITSGTGTMYFQRTGSITSDAVGVSPTDYTIGINGMSSIVVAGVTGYVN